MDFIRERGEKSRIFNFFAIFFAEISPPSLSHSHLRPIPAKAGISTPKAVIVQLPAALRRRRFLPSQEWDRSTAGNFAPTARRFRLSPEWRHF
ncbi:MAG: hypothetical protein ACR2QC_04735 [Gammaproteobacteria bacterium]